MSDALAVEVLESTGNLLDEPPDILLGYCASALDKRREVTARTVLHDKVNIVFIPLSKINGRLFQDEGHFYILFSAFISLLGSLSAVQCSRA